jgi:hypothetical protein
MLAFEKTGPASSYRLFGLALRSEIDLSGLAPCAEIGVPDVEISYGPIAAAEATPGYSETAEGTLLSIPDVGRYLIREGRQIVIDPAPEASERNLRLFLLGSAFGALLHQRDLMPLHANAIMIGESAVAFCGHSGAGKSTIAAWFHDHGHQILADDVCVIGFDSSETALVRPGIARLRLWREALESRGRAVEDYERSFDGMDKYDVPTHQIPQAPLPLAAIYLLGRSPEDQHKAAIKRLSGVEAVDELVSNTYRGGYLKTVGRNGVHLMQCLRIAKAVPVYQADRPWGFGDFDAQAKVFSDHAHQIAMG